MPGFNLISCLVVTSLSVSLAATLSTNVIVVAPSGGNYTDIQPAIDAAADGDTILVKQGSYSGFAIVGRARLDVVAEAGGSVQVQGNVRIRNCTESILVSGLTVNAPHTQVVVEQPGLALTDNLASVRVLSCSFRSSDALGAQVRRCADVELAGCTFIGGGSNWNSSGSGVYVDQSSVVLAEDILRGTDGYGAICGYIGANGADGLTVAHHAFVFASRCDIHGGAGVNILIGADAGNGGNGVRSWDASTVHVRDSVVSGGPGGQQFQSGGVDCGSCWCCSCFYDGNPGQPYVTDSTSTLDLIPGPGRTLSMPDVAREQQVLTLQVGGAPGDSVVLSTTLVPGFTWQPVFSGVFLGTLSPPPRYVSLGTIGASGMLNASLPITNLGPGMLALKFHLQALHHDTQGNTILGSGRTLLVLDSSL